MVFPFDFPGLSHWEGARTRLFSLSRGLLDRGYDVHILSKRDREYQNEFYDEIPLHFFEAHNEDSRRSKFISPLLIGKKIRQIEKRQEFDIIHLHLPIVAASAALWKPLISAKTVFDTHDWYKLHDELYYNIKFLPSQFSGVVNAIERQISMMHDQVLVTTPLLVDLLGKGMHTFVVPNAVDTSHFKPTNSNFRERAFPKNSFVVGFLGVVSVYQGVWKLLEAAKIALATIPTLKILIIGNGSVNESKEFAKRLGIEDRVIFTGPRPVPYSELPDYINSMDVAVSPLQPFPLYQDYAQPLKVLEYLACGIPVVVTPLREQTRLIREAGSGKVAVGYGAKQIADAIISFYNDGKIKKKSASRDYVIKNYSTGAVLDDLQKAFERALI